MKTTPWWDEAFQQHYLAIYAHRDDQSAVEEIAGVLPRIQAQSGPVLDACCGNGRHLAALRAAGLPAWGFDYSHDLLRVAAARPETAGYVFRSDVRAPAIGTGWGAITLFFTAFGYFDDEQNARTLEGLAQALRPGGLLLIDVPNPERVRINLVPESHKDVDGLHIHEQRSLSGQRVEKRVRLEKDGKELQSYTESVRLYETDEMARMAQAAGLDVEACWPSLRGPDHDDDRHVYWLRS